MVSEFPIIGPGGTYTFQDTNVDLLVYHYYDGLNNGKPRLGINSLGYTDDGWPYVY
jgi:arabinan endo-1,5-alpha-L-arabinosidase